MERGVRSARIAIGVVFAITGATFATWASRVPAVRERLELTPAELGLALLGLAAGAVVALPLSGALVVRWGSRRVGSVGLVVYCLALVGLAAAPSLPLLAAALVAFGGGNSALDVAISVQGVGAERHYGRPIMAGFNGLFSLGGLLGALLGAGVATAGVDVFPHFSLAAAFLLLAGLAGTRRFLPDARGNGHQPLFVLPGRGLVLLAVVALCAFLTEGVIQDWSAVYLRDVTAAPAGLAAMGLAGFMLTMAGGRFLADRLVLWAGPARFTRLAGLLAVAGLALAAATRAPLPAVAGFTLAGAGLAGLAPLVFSLAGHQAQLSVAPAVAAVSTVGYLGFLVGPVLMGAVAELWGLRVALAGVLVFPLLVVALSTRLAAQHPVAGGR